MFYKKDVKEVKSNVFTKIGEWFSRIFTGSTEEKLKNTIWDKNRTRM